MHTLKLTGPRLEILKDAKGPYGIGFVGDCDKLIAWQLRYTDYLFPSKPSGLTHISTRQYSRIVSSWVDSIGLDSAAYGTHSLRRTKASLIYRRTKNLRAVQILLGHTKLVSTVRYLGIEVDDALELAEQTEC